MTRVLTQHSDHAALTGGYLIVGTSLLTKLPVVQLRFSKIESTHLIERQIIANKSSMFLTGAQMSAPLRVLGSCLPYESSYMLS